MIGFWVALGGGLGAVARFAISGWAITWTHATFPWGTLAINVLGSTALGFLNRALPAPAASRAFFTIGLCGGFTTFSTFDFEALALLLQARYATAALYSFGTVTACIAGVLSGIWLADWLTRRPPGRKTPRSNDRLRA